MQYIITGSPGTGKTSLINALKSNGYTCFDEIARKVIQEQKLLNTDVLPWLNLQAFSDEILAQMLKQETEIASRINKPVFFDRAIPDIMAYLHLGNLPVSKHYFEALAKINYHKNVFITPPWKAIYTNDNERIEPFEFAEKLHTILVKTYSDLGFKLIEVPFVDIEERVTFVASKISKKW